jgi:carbonic anhydrase/acetyltransferase-like protein (isoleucine patch superfamily)
MIHAFRGLLPDIHPGVLVVESAQIIGEVAIGEDSSVWFNAVIRGDVNPVRIGRRTNIQDGALLHVRSARNGTGCPLVIGSDVTVGHGAILHGCTIADLCLVGMGAIILDNAKINSYTLVAAGTVVTPGTEIPDGVLVAGVPGRIIRSLGPDERAMIANSALDYVGYAGAYKQS